MKISEAIKIATTDLKKSNIEESSLKARLLMQYVLDKTRQYILVNDREEISKELENKYFSLVKELEKNIPIEHITHKKEFMKLNFFVDENVLIPRQDTEILVEEVIELARNMQNKKILDLCTGSGAIAISIAKYLSDSEIIAIDISDKALEIANKNAIENNVENQIKFVKSDLFECIENEKFDIIVSNPPYIKTNIIKDLEEQVKKEPIIALDGGADGLDFYRKIIKESKRRLNEDGYLCLEIGFDQKKEVIDLIENEGEFEEIYSKKDLYGNDRIVIAKIKSC